MNIQMVDVKTQYQKIKSEIDSAMQEVIDTTSFINGPAVKKFKGNLEDYLDVNHVIPCANGTDALQIAMMALGLKPGDEVIVPAFTYVATAEVIALLGLIPKMVDVDPMSFNLTTEIVKANITEDTKAVVPVHLYGQSAEMESLMALAQEEGFYVVEDNAQAIGSDYIFDFGNRQKAGTIGHIGTTSFYPSKNLGAYGDGGALFTNDDKLANNIQMVANHGQSRKYVHDVIGCNSRLDSIQAALLDVKLKYLDTYCETRRGVADIYDQAFADIDGLEIPYRVPYSTHVFHQYTLKIKNGRRDRLKEFLKENDIPSMIYYPLPLYKQSAFQSYAKSLYLPVTEELCDEVISLPIHTEMKPEELDFITDKVRSFFA